MENTTNKWSKIMNERTHEDIEAVKHINNLYFIPLRTVTNLSEDDRYNLDRAIDFLAKTFNLSPIGRLISSGNIIEDYAEGYTFTEFPESYVSMVATKNAAEQPYQFNTIKGQ